MNSFEKEKGSEIIQWKNKKLGKHLVDSKASIGTNRKSQEKLNGKYTVIEYMIY